MSLAKLTTLHFHNKKGSIKTRLHSKYTTLTTKLNHFSSTSCTVITSELKTSSKSQTLQPSWSMEREPTTNRRIAATLLLSVVLAAASLSLALASEAAFVKKTVSSHKIVIFSKSYCPYCRRAKEVFKELQQTPHVIELDERDDGWDIQDALGEFVGRRTVPQVFIDGKHIGGSDDTFEAYQSGKLAKLLGIESTDNDDL